MKSGFVSFIGRPNVGKSTLLNAILNRKVAITSNKPQTTRNIIQGIYNDEDSQIVFVDTPGIHKPSHRLGKYLNEQAYYSIQDVDVILFMTDIKEPLGAGDLYILERLKEVKKPVILLLNKIDGISKLEILPKIQQYKDLYPFADIVPVSALKKENLKDVIDVVKSHLTDSIRYYEEDQYTNKPLEFLLAELVREKVFQLTEEEVPHSVTCVVDAVEVGKNSYTVSVSIIVDRDNLKRILIGKQGAMIKQIGTEARKDMEQLLGKRVYLQLFVKTIKKWRDKEKYLAEFGYRDFE